MNEEQRRRALQPTPEEIRTFRESSGREIASEMLRIGARRALDVGCGDGRFTRLLAQFCESVSGIDVQQRRVENAKAAARAAGLEIDFRAAPGEALPYPDGMFDLIVFSNSLHHMDDAAQALGEAVRVLAPAGRLYVMEPIAAGNYFEAAKPVNDETEVRRQAYDALQALAEARLAPVSEVIYRSRRTFASFADWKAEQIDVDERRRAKFDAQPDAIRQRFESGAERVTGGFAFDQVFRVNLLRKAA